MKNINKILLSCLILLITVFSVQTFFTKKYEVFAENRQETNYNSYSALLNSYQNFSYDYNNESLQQSYNMRDEYMIYAEQQSVMGLCWAFGSEKVLTTTVMKATGEYLDLSEAWVGTALTYGDKHNELPNYNLLTTDQYVVGDGGYFIGYDLVAQKYGLMLEQDFEYENVYNISLENVDNFYNHYNQYASYNFRDNLVAGKFANYNNSSNKSTIIKSIKNHIVKHGAVGCGMRFGDILQNGSIIYKQPSVNVTEGHFITLIGWDDSISLTVDNTKYTGAWIALNSYGNEVYNKYGNEGLIYVFYDDTNYDSYFWGYKYEKDKSLNAYYIDEISYSTDKPLYDTKQNNIFYQQDSVEIEYTYEISNNTNIDKVSIFRNTTDVSNLFNIDTETKNKIKIDGNNVKTGSYKVLIEYSNQENFYKHINMFFVCDGTEINFAICIDYEEDSSEINNAGYYQIYNTYSVEDEELVYATNGPSIMYVKITFATYHDVVSVKFNDDLDEAKYLYKNVFGIAEYVDPSKQTEYYFEFITSKNISRFLKVRVVDVSTNATDEILTNVFYELDGSSNAETNYRKLVVKNNQDTIIQNPSKTGYTFLGWYYSENFESTTKLKNSNGTYYLEYNKVNKEKTPTLFSNFYKGLYKSYYNALYTVMLYAKFEKTIITVSFDCNGGQLVDEIIVNKGDKIEQPITSKTGYDFIGWYKESTFENLWDFEKDVVNDSITLYAYFELQEGELNLSVVKNNFIVGEDIDLILQFDHPLSSQATYSVIWKRNKLQIDTNSVLNYTDKLNIHGRYEYTAIATITINGEQLLQSSNDVEIKVESIINPISIIYDGNGKFNILDNDVYSSNYNIKVYSLSGIVKTYNQNNKIVDISDIINNVGSYYISVQKSYNGDSLEYVHSENVEIVSYKLDENDITLVDKGVEIQSLAIPTKIGYSFKEWRVDGNKINFPYVINQNTIINSVWELQDITSATIEVNSLQQEYGKEFELIINYEHSIIPKSVWYEIYVDEVLSQTTYSDDIQLILNKMGTSKIHAIVYFNDGNETVNKKTNELNINVYEGLKPLSSVNYIGNKVFEIVDTNSFISNYEYNVYFNNLNVFTGNTINKSIDISSIVNENGSGNYHVSVIKSYDGETLEAVLSNFANILKISFRNVDNSLYKEILLDKGDNFNKPINPTKYGYNFVNWLANSSICNFPITVNSDLILEPRWVLKDLVVDNIENFETTYDKNLHKISLKVSHELEGGEYIYSWKKNNIEVSTDKDLSVKFVNDSGEYFCDITYIFNGERISTKTNDFSIVINKAVTTLDLTGLQNAEYTYNGQVQIINSGVLVVRTDELPEITYKNNTFVNVPNNQILNVEVLVSETDNYLPKTDFVSVKINKAISNLNVENNQTFTYTKTAISPDYSINNNEQEIEISYKPTNAGLYNNISIKALESNNYLENQCFVNIEIVKAKLTVSIDNKKSYLFFDLKEFSYQITSGTLYNGDYLNEIYLCDVDKSKAGDYAINLIANNNNYEVTVLSGVYVVSATPHKIIGGVIGGTCMSSFVFISLRWITKKKMEQGVLNKLTSSGNAIRIVNTNKNEYTKNNINSHINTEQNKIPKPPLPKTNIENSSLKNTGSIISAKSSMPPKPPASKLPPKPPASKLPPRPPMNNKN